jgi:hypothetical protein
MTSRVAFANAIAPKLEKSYDAGRIDIKLSHGLFEIAWIETKRANTNEARMFAQLILTAKPLLDRGTLPPMLLGTYDTADVAFIRFADVLPIFTLNDINWNETPSSPSPKTIKAINALITGKIKLFKASNLEAVRDWLNSGTLTIGYIPINASNFVHIFHRWLTQVWPAIALPQKLAANLRPADFYLADIMSENNQTFSTNLKVLLQTDHYKVAEKPDDDLFREIHFKDNATAHTSFWDAYKRPPRHEFQNLILTRRDLLIEQNIRERKGAFFTPKRWVEKAHEYLARAFGETWAEDNLIWDCAAGTGNLLAGLGNKRSIFASDYDPANVRVTKEGNIVLADHAFQFDFLNGSLTEIPEEIHKAAANEKLIILINPPYAESRSHSSVTTGHGKKGTNLSNIRNEMTTLGIGNASNEIFAQFLYRIKRDFPTAKLGVFATMKYVNAQNFIKFREYWNTKFHGGFVVPAWTFDNVKGKFPIGFCTWTLNPPIKTSNNIILDVFDENNTPQGQKIFWDYQGPSLNQWRSSKHKSGLAFLASCGSDFQHNNFINLRTLPDHGNPRGNWIAKDNLLPSCIYLAVRHCIPHTWLNNRDQFLHPLPTWESDDEFKADCLIFTLFHSQNHIDSRKGPNHWIPFDETTLGSRKSFTSDFMAKTLKTITISSESLAVLHCGLAAWRHYFTFQTRSDFNHNAGIYEIKEFFRGRNNNGRLNSNGPHATFENLMKNLMAAYKPLSEKLASKCHEHGFLSLLKPNPETRAPKHEPTLFEI